jgi:hypothetical protein
LVNVALIEAANWWNNFSMSVIHGDLDSFSKLVEGLRELEITIGPQARAVIEQVRAKLVEATELRRNGDAPETLRKIRQAMAGLTALAGNLDPAEGMLMKLIADRFTEALDVGDKGVAKETVNFIRHRAGDPKDDPNVDW